VFRAVALGLVPLGTVLAVAVLEFIASFHVSRVSDSFITNFRINHTWPPNSRMEHGEWANLNPEYPEPYVHCHNRQGWIEEYDVRPAKPSGTYRIFYVGDSFTEGCVPMDESVPSRVETWLNGKLGKAGVRYEVINTGTSSYSPVIEYILVRHIIQPYSPDLVVVNVDMTDDYDDWKYRETLIVDPEGNPWAAPSRDIYSAVYMDTAQGAMRTSAWGRLSLRLYSKSYLYNLLQEAARERAEKKQWKRGTEPSEKEAGTPTGQMLHRRWAWCEHEWDALTKENVRFTLDVLARLADFCNANRIKLLLTGVPHYRQFATDDSGKTEWSIRPHLEIEKVAKAKGVAYLDSVASLRPLIQGSPQHKYYYRNDIHFNPEGTRIWAEAHFKAISDRRSKLLPGSAYAALGKE
jgi:lysophospholipase L1-like esterase